MKPNVLSISLAALLLVAGCSKPADDRAVLARVGDEVITAEEFQLNYEFGYGHLRRGDDPRRDVLHFMINEKIMAREAARLRLDTAQAVVHALHTLREELLIERVFEAHVLDSIEVTEAEIRDEVNKAAVSFQFRFLPALNEDDGHLLREDIRARGWDAVFEERKARFAEIREYEREMTSPHVKAADVEPAVLEIIKDLPVLEPSAPILYGGQWYVFQVMDIRRERVAPTDYADKEGTYRKVIYNRKAMEQGTRFVAQTMAPFGVTTRREGLDILHDALLAWYTEETPARNLLHLIEEQGLDTPYTRLLIDNGAVPLVRFGSEEWTIRTFLEHFTPGRYQLRAGEEQAFRARLTDIVALVVRDKVFLDIAEREDLADNDAYRRNLALWKQKWMFQELRDRLRARTPDGRLLDVMSRFTDSVYAAHDVFVNDAMLDSLSLSISEQNPTATVHLFKSNSNKMPFPIVDPNWKPVQ